MRQQGWWDSGKRPAGGGGVDSNRLGSSQVEVENTPLVGDVLEYMGFYRVKWRGVGEVRQ